MLWSAQKRKLGLFGIPLISRIWPRSTGERRRRCLLPLVYSWAWIEVTWRLKLCEAFRWIAWNQLFLTHRLDLWSRRYYQGCLRCWLKSILNCKHKIPLLPPTFLLKWWATMNLVYLRLLITVILKLNSNYFLLIFFTIRYQTVDYFRASHQADLLRLQ